jgi:hypothetical protein
MAQSDDALMMTIMQRLELDHQYVEDIPAMDDDRINRVRRAGRTAARRLGWKVVTMARDLDNGKTRVWLVITESTPEDEERIRERGDLLIREAFRDLDDQ